MLELKRFAKRRRTSLHHSFGCTTLETKETQAYRMVPNLMNDAWVLPTVFKDGDMTPFFAYSIQDGDMTPSFDYSIQDGDMIPSVNYSI